MAALIPDERCFVSACFMFISLMKQEQAVSGTSAAAYKVMDPHSEKPVKQDRADYSKLHNFNFFYTSRKSHGGVWFAFLSPTTFLKLWQKEFFLLQQRQQIGFYSVLTLSKKFSQERVGCGFLFSFFFVRR